MIRPNFRKHQKEALEATSGKTNSAFYLGMGAGKTFVATERMLQYGNEYNLCICQASKVEDWIEHFKTYTDLDVIDFTKPKAKIGPGVIVTSYGTAWRRNALYDLRNFTLLLDESSKVQHENTKQTQFIMSLRPKNVILASGTPCNGKYENLYTQLQLMGAPFTKSYFWNRYIEFELRDVIDWSSGKPKPTGKMYRHKTGYKNVDELKSVMRKLGSVFMLSDDVLDLPEKTEQIVRVKSTPEYRKFRTTRIVIIDDVEYVGDTILKKMLRERQLCAGLSKPKLDALSDLLDSTEDRLVIFYNFQEEFVKISQICDIKGKKMSIVNGKVRDLTAYRNDSSSVTVVQYQSGAHGLNLQLANKMILFSPPLSCELFDQAKARIHRMGQTRPTMYWHLLTQNSIEEKIYKVLLTGHDYTVELFKGSE